MTRKNRFFKKQKNKVIQKNLIRNISVIVILIVFLFVIYRFNFSSKSEIIETVKINFKEFGTDIALENQEVDMEVLTDFDGTKYIILPETINGYYVRQYYVSEISAEEGEETASYSTKKKQNVLLENVVIDDEKNLLDNTIILDNNTDNSIENKIDDEVIDEIKNLDEIAGLKNKYLTSQNYEESEKSEDSKELESTEEPKKEDSNVEIDDKKEETKNDVTNEVTNNVVNNEITNSVTNNSEVNNGNTVIENVVTGNTVESNENDVNEDDKTYFDNKENMEIQSDIFESTMSIDLDSRTEEIRPGTRYNVYPTEEEGKYTLGNISIEVEYDSITNGEIRLYKQELVFEESDTKISAIGYIPAGYSLNAEKANKDNIQNKMLGYDDLKDYQVLCGYNISIKKDDTFYQPLEGSLKINIISTELASLQSELNPKLIHFTESDVIETIEPFEIDSSSIEFNAVSFSEYAVISEKAITEERIIIDTREDDYNYYRGRYYTDNKSGEHLPEYTGDNLAKVTINYHGDFLRTTTTEEAEKENNINVIPVKDNIQFEIASNTSAWYSYSIDFDEGLQITDDWRIEIQLKDTNPKHSITKIELDTDDIEAGVECDPMLDIKNKCKIFSEKKEAFNRNLHFRVQIKGSSSDPADLKEYGEPLYIKVYCKEMTNIKYVADEALIGNGRQNASISLDETQNLVSYMKCIPIDSEGNISIDLIDNPFMKRPIRNIEKDSDSGNYTEQSVQFGFNGWGLRDISDDEIKIGINEYTFLQTLKFSKEMLVENEIEINLYVDWVPANTIFFKSGASGDGSSVSAPIGSWSNALTELKNKSNNINITNASKREGSIIVVIGDVRNEENIFSTSDVPYTVTSLYGDKDYREKATITINKPIKTSLNDLQMDFLRIDNVSSDESYVGDFTETVKGNHINGNSRNLRIGRGIITTGEKVVFSRIQCGSDNDSEKEYRTVIESGKYNSIIINGGTATKKDLKTNANIVIGNDFDDNNTLNVYYKIISRSDTSGRGIITPLDDKKPIYDICVKSGNIGMDCFKDSRSTNSCYAGIYVGGMIGNSSNYDEGKRVLTVEGGNIANIVGGIKGYDGHKPDTYIYIKGKKSNIQSVIGGSVLIDAFGDRVIQATGGTIQYSIISASNGEKSSSSQGRLYGNVLTYIGGNVVVGGNGREVFSSNENNNNLYGIEYGSVFGAGNGNKIGDKLNGGIVNGTTHIIIDKNAKIANTVYGGGNYGKSSESTIDILGGTIGKNVYGGSNNNGIDGNTTIKMSNGKVEGTIYGGSNFSGIINGKSVIEVSGGTINGKVEDTAAVLSVGETKENEAIFAGGKGEKTHINNGVEINIKNNNPLSINGNIYGGSALGNVTGSAKIQIDKTTENEMKIVGKVFGAGKGSDAGIEAANIGDINVSIDGGNYPNLNVFGGANINGVINGNINVEIGKSKPTTVSEVYGGGNKIELKSNNSTQYEDNVTLGEYAKAKNVYNGGNDAGIKNDLFKPSLSIDGATVINVYGGSNNIGTLQYTKVHCNNAKITNIYGAGFGNGTVVTGNAELIIENCQISGNVYGGGCGENAKTGKTNVALSNSNVQNVYGGGELGTIDGSTKVKITSSTVNGNVYGAGKGKYGTDGNANGQYALVKGSAEVVVEGDSNIKGDLYGGGDAANVGNIGVAETDTTFKEGCDTKVFIAGATIEGNVYGAANNSKVWGNSYVYIGNGALIGNVQGKIDIKGTVFGGGRSLTTEEEFNNYFLGVNGTVFVDINGTNYDIESAEGYDINIGGSIFGSGNASKTGTDGKITITKYGTDDTIKRLNSIQRSSETNIINSVIYILGARDSTNNLKTKEYTFNNIAHLKLKNNTTLYLKKGAKVLENLSSLKWDEDTGVETPAYVNIDEDDNYKVTDQNVDNRIYMYSGTNLDISGDENAASRYGDVKGMTFFGLFNDDTGPIDTGVYNKDFMIGTAPTWSQRDFARTYVLGKHMDDHDITKNGFYTVYEKLDSNLEILKQEGLLTEELYSAPEANISSYIYYIEPEPPEGLLYRWYTGFKKEIIKFDIDLIASRYSTVGTENLSMNGLDKYPNATLSLVDFSISNDWRRDMVLDKKDSIKNMQPDQNIANTHFGLVMKTGNDGWTNTGSTEFLVDKDKFHYEDRNSFVENESYIGSKDYILENITSPPTMGFYLYNSNNINLRLPPDSTLGIYKLRMLLSYLEGATYSTVDVIVNITIKTPGDEEKDDGYNAAITPGMKYDLFTRTSTDITSKSSFSVFFELAQPNFTETRNLYRVINTGYVFPENTTITMIDKAMLDKGGTSNNNYYYYTVTERDRKDGKTEYRLKDFICMGNTKLNYEENTRNSEYLDGRNKYEYECFIFIVNFKNAKFSDEEKGKDKITESPEFTIQLRADNREDPSRYDIIAKIISSQSGAKVTSYDIYNAESSIAVDATIANPILYIGGTNKLTVNTKLDTELIDNVKIYDTEYFDKKLGAIVSLYKKDGADKLGEQVTNNLRGMEFKVNGTSYIPNESTGKTRIKMAELVSNISTPITIDASRCQSLSNGEYFIVIETFGSADGLYYGGLTELPSCKVLVNITGGQNGLNSIIPPNQVIIDKKTGCTLNDKGYASKDLKDLNVTLQYVSALDQPYITVSLERRKYGEIDIARPNNELLYNMEYEPTYKEDDETIDVKLENYVEIAPTDEDPTTELKNVTAEVRPEVKTAQLASGDLPEGYFRTLYEALDTEKLKSPPPDGNFTLNYKIKPNLKSGTYRLVFTLYNKNETEEKTVYDPIETVYSYIIIK